MDMRTLRDGSDSPAGAGPDAIGGAFAIHREFFDRLKRGVAIYTGIDPDQQAQTDLSPKLMQYVQANLNLGDFTGPPFRRQGRAFRGFANGPANAGSGSYVELINPVDSNLIVVVDAVTVVAATTVNIKAAAQGVTLTLASPGAATVGVPALEKAAPGPAVGLPGVRGLGLENLLILGSSGAITEVTQIDLLPNPAPAGYPIGLVLYPGASIIAQGVTINVTLTATWAGRVFDIPSTFPVSQFP